MCCSMLQRVVVFRSVLQCTVAEEHLSLGERVRDKVQTSLLQYDAVCCSVMQYDAACCSVLQCDTVCCSVP